MHNGKDNLISVLMYRDGLNRTEAVEQIQEAASLVLLGEDPKEVLYEEFGLELDYVFDLLEYCR